MSHSPNRDRTGASDPATYEEGYLNGRSSERRLQEDRYVVRENDNAASGLLLGLAIAALIGIVGGTLYFMNQRQDSPTQRILPIPVPNNSQPQSQPKTSEKNTTIIEKTVDKTKQVIPVPQPQAPAPQQKAPDININIPSPSQEKSAPEQPATTGADKSQSSSGGAEQSQPSSGAGQSNSSDSQ